MKTFTSDFAYRAAEHQRKRAMDKDDLRHILREGVAYAIIAIVSAGMFVLAVVESAK